VTPPDVVRIAGGRRLTGRLRTPGDKSISHRVLLLGSLAAGTSRASNLSDGDDVARTLAAVRALGAGVDRRGGEVEISGGRDRLVRCDHIDCGNSGTTLRLLAGLIAPIRGTTELTGDASLRRRPMDRVAEPLRAMGASLTGEGPQLRPPLVVTGGRLHAVDWTPAMASAQVKSAILLAGLDADGETVVREPVATRAHTEELLASAGAAISVEPAGAGRVVRVRRSELRPLEVDVPGDPSQAAFWLVAATVAAGSAVVVERVYAGVERTGFVAVLDRMGAAVVATPAGAGMCDLSAEHRSLVGTEVAAAEIPSLDEVPVLAVAAALAEGTTTFRDVGELTVKESDRRAATVELVRAMGARAEVRTEDLVVEGNPGARGPLAFDAAGDHRLAMAAAVAAAALPAGGTVSGAASIVTSYPSFLDHLRALAGQDAWAPAA
jgi:3-phosphoshikimate 1-carboxyvinyltransferase